MEESEASKSLITVFFFFCSFSVQDFLDKAKKEFEENWSKNPKVSFLAGAKRKIKFFEV